MRRENGEIRGPLDGIPYTAKNSYKVKDLTVAAGSPAFAKLVATDDAFTIAQLRKAGAILLGLTNMPPMANGGMQRGVYGRAESPYNADYLTAAFASGSSNGSGTATAASFAAFGLGRRNMVQWPLTRIQQRAVRLYSQSRRHFCAWQLAIGTHNGRCCAAYAHNGRYVGSLRHPGRRRS